MKKILIVLLAIGLMACVGCGKKEQEVQLPQQKAPVGKEVPVAPNVHKQETEKKKEIKTGNKEVDDFMNGEADWDTKPIKSTGFK